MQKKVFTKDSALLADLIMGVEYLVKVCIIENNEEVALTRWEKVGLPEVAAIPGYEIDKDNPYLIKLKGWKPEPHDDHDWKYSWIIDNQEIASAQLSQDYAYEFATSGTKTIQLKVANKENTATSISEPFTVKIKTDIEPIVEHTIINSDKTYIELDASQSRGNKIDLASAAWVISGPGSLPIGPYTGSKIILGLEGFTHKINVNLKVRRKTVAGQQDTDVIEKNYVYDLDLEEVKPVITYNADNNNPRLFIFSGENSLGNIDWYRARWLVYADGIELHREDGVSSFAYPFPEMGNETSYSVTLTVPRRNDGQTKTTSVIVSVDPCPIEPVIDYEILTLKDGHETIGAKLLLSCSGSKGSSIDFNSARWSVPVAGSYNEQPTQGGPTAIYNLFTTEEIGLIDVSLTLMRRGGTDATTITELIRITPGELSEIDMRINKEMQKSTTGTEVTLDILQSRGVNIEWEKTTWHITTGNSPVTITGPVAQVNISSSAETTIINYVCSVYRYGITEPVVKRGAVMLDNSMIRPVISYELIPGKTENLYSLSILDTPGVNIDWERTTWYIYDGNETVTNKYGAKIVHAFALKSEAFGYPVMVEMFFKGNTKPFTGYTSIDVAGDELVPFITWDRDYKSGDDNVFTFTARDSSGSNIDWSQAKWTFGDSSEFQYGPVVVHKFPVDDAKKEYRISLTLTRKSVNNQIETKTVYKTVNIAGDTLKPVIKGQIGKNGYLILSAGDSEGRGLLLDRSLWIFEGKGDNESLNVNEKIGEVISTSDATSTNNTIQVVPSISAWTAQGGASVGGIGYIYSWGDSSNTNITEYDGFKDMTTAYSSSNIHTGALCRKYVREFDTSEGSWNRESKRSIMVTLFVYRIGPDGGMTGKSITVNIDLEKASDPGGVRYE